MEISDYIPNYPDLDDPYFNDRIFHKKEFYDLRTGEKPPLRGQPGDLWNHQQLLARFVSPYTAYNVQLLFHSPGTGKTCGASAIIEVSKMDPLIRKPVLVIVPNDSLVNQWKQQIALVCTTGQYIPENYFSNDPMTKLSSEKKTTRINKLIAPVYHITTMERMRRHIDKLSDQILRNRYSNTIIIIDEAHNLRIQVHTTKKMKNESEGRYKAFHRFLHLVENSKILLLSGTPMYDRIGELPGIMNLILPLDQQLPTGIKFTKEFLERVEHVRKMKNINKLYEHLVGKVSYIREGGNFPRRKDLGKPVWTKFLKTVNVEMSDTQLEGYLQAYHMDTDREKSKMSGLWKNSRQAAVFVYKDKADSYLWGTNASKLLTVTGKPMHINIGKRKLTISPLNLNTRFREDIKKNLEIYSAKYYKIIKYLEKHPNEATFIFTPLVSGAGGAIFFGLILELFGYSKVIGATKSSSKNYAIITGDDKSSLQRKKLIELFNSPANVNGEIIQIMVATKTIAEGTSFVNVRNEIVISPYWNNSGTEQAISRGLRADSLRDLPEKDRVVTVQELACESSKLFAEENIDAHMYKMSESKDFEIKMAERVLKKVAWDCSLNYDRNVRTNDKQKSRNCDYQTCNYTCYQVTPEKVKPRWVYSIPEDKLDESTYLLYYSRPELLEVVKKIQNVLKKYSLIDIKGLNDNLNLDSFKLLILAIEYIIENNVSVYNRWGQACFLRKKGNMLFLSDTPTDRNILGSWYARYPYANQETPLTEIINDELYARDLSKLEALNLKDLAKSQEIIHEMSLDSKIFILEYLLQLTPEALTKKQRKLYDIFTSLFDSYIFRINGAIIHNLKKLKLQQSFIDFTKGEGGSLCCLRDGKWENCEKKQEEELSKNIKDIKAASTLDIIKNKYGVYGILSSDGKFKLADKTKEKTVNDRRGIYTGKTCRAGWNKWELIALYLRLNIDSPVAIDTSIKNKTTLIDAIKKNKVYQAVPKNASVSALQKILTLSKLDISKLLCGQLEKWFTEHNLLVKED
jgi:superfamily II DNA or RNA helicase